MTYKLFKTQTILLSASCRKGLLDPTYILFKTHSMQLSVSFRKGIMDLNIQPVQIPDHSIVRIMQKRPPGLWLTSCLKPQPFYCQHYAEKASWTQTYILFKTRPIVSIMQKRPSGPRLTSCSKPRAVYCQYHAEKASWTLTHILFKTQTSLLSISCRKGLLNSDLQAVKNPDHSTVRIMQKSILDSDLHPVQNPDHSIVSIGQKKPSGPWLTPCLKPRAAHCQHHIIQNVISTYNVWKVF